MSREIYGGESGAKRLARVLFWDSVNVELTRDDELGFALADYLVLGSRHLGDVSVLTAWGLPETQVFIADIDAEAIAGAQERYPDALSFHGDIADVAARHRGRFACAFVDLCGIFSRSNVKTFARVAARGLTLGGVLGIGFMRGRKESTYAQLYTQQGAREAEALGCTGAHDPGRTAGIWLAINDQLVAHGLRCDPRWSCTYTSTTKDKHGVPMLYSWARVVPLAQGRPRKTGEHINITSSKIAEDAIRRLVLSGEDPYFRARLLNVPAPRVAAWKAVAARRTAA